MAGLNQLIIKLKPTHQRRSFTQRSQKNFTDASTTGPSSAGWSAELAKPLPDKKKYLLAAIIKAFDNTVVLAHGTQLGTTRPRHANVVAHCKGSGAHPVCTYGPILIPSGLPVKPGLLSIGPELYHQCTLAQQLVGPGPSAGSLFLRRQSRKQHWTRSSQLDKLGRTMISLSAVTGSGLGQEPYPDDGRFTRECGQ